MVFPIPTPTPLDVDLMENEIIALLINFNIAYPNCCHALVDASTYTIGDGNCTEGYNTRECLYDGGDCCPFDKDEDQEYHNNGVCNGGLYNTEACDYDGGDCIAFNLQYRDCRIEELALQVNVTKSVILGDGVCDSGVYMREDCGYEGNDDCKECVNKIPNGTENLIGNGICNGGVYITGACSNDGGDCDAFTLEYPDCPIEELALHQGNVTNSVILGDGVCDSDNSSVVLYDIPECGYEGNDCRDVPNRLGVPTNLIGLVFVILLCFVSILLCIKLKKNADGRMLVESSA